MTPRPGSRIPTENGQSVQVAAWQGEGSFAQVFRAQYSRTSGACALKLCKAAIPGAATRLIAQREILAGIRHPYVVSLLDWGCHETSPFLVLEWLDGDTLHEVLAARRRLPLRQALDVLENLLDGLDGLHTAGRCHGDVRCSNILLVPGRGAVLTDPGSPPGYEGDSTARDTGGSAQADVTAAGRILHRLLTGEDPGDPSRLTVRAGFNPRVVDLWTQTQQPSPPAARHLLTQARVLRAGL